MKNVERKELAKKLGVENVLVNYYGEFGYKTSLTIIYNKDLALNYIGKTYSFIPLTADGLGKGLNGKSVNNLLNNIKEELQKEVELVKDNELEIEKD